MTSRFLKIVLWLFLISICTYVRFFHEFQISGNALRINNILLSLIIILLTFKVIIDAIAFWYKLDANKGKGRMRDNLIVGLSNLFSIVSIIAIILGFLSIFGLKPNEVFTSLSIFAAALAIISKDFIAEIIVGIFNGFSTKIEIDDYIRIGKYKGRVVDIGLQKITLLSDGGDLIFIPNLKFYNEEIVNFTKLELRQMSIEFGINPKYAPDAGKLESSIIAALQKYKDTIDLASCHLMIVEVTNEAINFEFEYLLNENIAEIKSDVRKEVLRIIYDKTYFNGI